MNVTLSKELVCPACGIKFESVDPSTFDLAKGSESPCSVRCAFAVVLSESDPKGDKKKEDDNG